MDAKDFSINNCANSEIIKDSSAIFPRVSIAILSHRFVVKAIHCCYLSRLMVSSKQSDTFGPLQFETEQELEGLNRVVAAIDEVSHEDVTFFWNFPTCFEQFEEVVELTVDVAANCNG